MIEVDENKPLRPIWISPNAPKVIVLPGDLSRCLLQSRVIGSAPAAPQKIGDTKESWIREIAVFIISDAVSSENVSTVVSQVFGLPCKFEISPGHYVWKTIYVKVDAQNRHKIEESYILKPKDYDYLTDKAWRRIKSYGKVSVSGESATIELRESQNDEQERKIEAARTINLKSPPTEESGSKMIHPSKERTIESVGRIKK
jgi:hypothetical protein